MFCRGIEAVGGNPAVVYHQDDPTTETVRYMRALDPAGETWGSPVVIVPNANFVLDATFRIINGCPAVAYYDLTADTLYYIQATDTLGSAWGTAVTVDSATAEDNLYLEEVNGCPAIKYGDAQYVRATSADGSTWGAPVAVPGGVRIVSGFEVIDGYPAISFVDETSWDLCFQRASDINGDTWFGATVVLDVPGFAAGARNDLVEVDGFPAICFYEGDVQDNSQFVRATDAGGSSWGLLSTLELGQDFSNEYVRLRVIGNRPMALYRVSDGTSYHLKIIRAGDDLGVNWGLAEEVNWPMYSHMAGLDYALCEVDGKPVVAYSGRNNLELRYGYTVD